MRQPRPLRQIGFAPCACDHTTDVHRFHTQISWREIRERRDTRSDAPILLPSCQIAAMIHGEQLQLGNIRTSDGIYFHPIPALYTRQRQKVCGMLLHRVYKPTEASCTTQIPPSKHRAYRGRLVPSRGRGAAALRIWVPAASRLPVSTKESIIITGHVRTTCPSLVKHQRSMIDIAIYRFVEYWRRNMLGINFVIYGSLCLFPGVSSPGNKLMASRAQLTVRSWLMSRGPRVCCKLSR